MGNAPPHGPLRIACDLDGVLADMESELARRAEVLFGRDGAASNLVATLSPSRQRRLWKHVQAVENFWETLAEHEPGIVQRLAAIAAEQRWDVIFLTKRPSSAGATAQIQSQRWLQSKGFPCPSVYVVRGSRGQVAAALELDVVVDDRPENCLDVIADSKARAILVWREPEQRMPASARGLGIGVVRTMAECLDLLSHGKAPVKRRRILDRVKRALYPRHHPRSQ